MKSEITMKSVILAGGLGTRLGNLTSAINKSLLPLDDSPIISHLIRFAQSATSSLLLTTTLGQVDNFARVVVNDQQIDEKNVYYNIQQKPIGIADALKYARSFCRSGPALVILGDNLHSHSDYQRILTICKDLQGCHHPFGAHIWVASREDAHNYGVLELDSFGIPIRIVEKPTHSTSKLVITGIYLFDELVWNYLDKLQVSKRGEYEITDVLNHYLSNDGLHVNHLNDEWFDIGQSIDSYWSIIYQRHNKL